MREMFIVIIFIYITLIISSCKENSTNPPNNGNGIDTTSHNFIWESYNIESPYDISQFLDAVIIDENNIWVGGYIDSIDIGIAYNAMHFDGSKWNFKKIPYYYQGSYIYSCIKWIFAISENDIWFSNCVHWNGERFMNAKLALSIFVGIGINKMWGSPNGEFYLAGNQGTVAYSPDMDLSWQELNSCINSDIQDIWGVTDIKTGQNVIYLVTDKIAEQDSSSVYQIVNNEVISAPSKGLPVYGFEGVWSADGEEWYICGNGLFHINSSTNEWKRIDDVPSFYMEAIRGNSHNDIFVVGHFGSIAHWNGSSWRSYTQYGVKYYGVACKDNIIVAVGEQVYGFMGGPASISIGRRN